MNKVIITDETGSTVAIWHEQIPLDIQQVFRARGWAFTERATPWTDPSIGRPSWGR